MIGIATLGLRHIDNQIAFFIVAAVFLEFFDQDTVALEIVNHIKGFLGIVVLVHSHWDDIVVWEEFFLAFFNPAYDLTIRSDEFTFCLRIFDFIDAAQVEVETHLHEFIWVLS